MLRGKNINNKAIIGNHILTIVGSYKKPPKEKESNPDKLSPMIEKPQKSIVYITKCAVDEGTNCSEFSIVRGLKVSSKNTRKRFAHKDSLRKKSGIKKRKKG